MKPADRLVLALDVPTADEALGWARRLRERVALFTVGLRLFTAEGPPLVSRIIGEIGPVFLDLKFHDIPNTVAAAVREASKLGVTMLTVHGLGGAAMLRAASEAADEASSTPRPRILAVTLLTSLDAGDLASAGIYRSPEEEVLTLAETAWRCGCDGVVASAREAAAIRARLAPGALIVTPGVRLADGTTGDHRRTATPREAIEAGADLVVVGRPILDAPDPEGALDGILRSIGAASPV